MSDSATVGGAGSAGWLSGRHREAAGIVLLLAGGQFLLVLMVGAALLPTYGLHTNAISDLGVGRTALLFNASVIVSGLGNGVAGWLYYRAHEQRWLLGLFVLAGLGAIGVGLFPETTGTPHVLFAMVAFVFLNLQGVALAMRVEGAMRWLGVLAGVVGLVALVAMVARAFGPIGFGGMERLIVYPVMLWLAGFGGVLVGRDEAKA